MVKRSIKFKIGAFVITLFVVIFIASVGSIAWAMIDGFSRHI